jgi:2-polyprenyl-3-methyl-5-hydroxy-6-metoxy-1,4-benzoquinol methylase
MRSTAPPDSCRLCGSRRIDPLFVKDAIPYLRCGVCGHQFSLPQGNANLDNRWEDYEPAYISYLAESADDAITMGALAGWMMRYAGLPGKDVLDVGCGSGKLVRHLHDLGAAATGIEPAKPLYDRFLAHAGAGYFNGTLGEFRIAHPDRRFDVLIANDVIEHLDDPLGFLTDLRAHGRPGGTIFIITPDAGSLLARGLGRWWHYYNRYHLSYLSRRSLSHLCARCNLELLSVTALTRQKWLWGRPSAAMAGTGDPAGESLRHPVRRAADTAGHTSTLAGPMGRSRATAASPSSHRQSGRARQAGA